LKQYIREYIRSIYDEKAKPGKIINFPDSVDHPIDMEKIIPANKEKQMPITHPRRSPGRRFSIPTP